MALQHYRFRTPSTGREVILPADPDRVYRDRDTGEELEVVGIVLPMAPSTSRLPAVRSAPGLAAGAVGLAVCGSDSSSGARVPASTPDLTIPGGADQLP